MPTEYIWNAILLMTAVTYIPRLLPLMLLSKYKLPSWFKTWLTFIPTAVFGALVFPDVFLNKGALDFSFANINLWVTLLIAPLAVKTKSLAATIIAGAVVFGLLQAMQNNSF